MVTLNPGKYEVGRFMLPLEVRDLVAEATHVAQTEIIKHQPCEKLAARQAEKFWHETNPLPKAA